jgi:hypothetical protein
MISRYIFFADKVEIQDITKQTSLFVLVGPKSSQVRDINHTFLVVKMTELVIFNIMTCTGNGKLEPRRSCWKTVWHSSTLLCKLYHIGYFL